MQHIAEAFQSGDFDIPMFVHDTVPPGVPEMKKPFATCSRKPPAADVSSLPARTMTHLQPFTVSCSSRSQNTKRATPRRFANTPKVLSLGCPRSCPWTLDHDLPYSPA